MLRLSLYHIMAGGLFDGKPFVINARCAVVSIVGIILFLLPGHQTWPNKMVFFIVLTYLFIMLYVAVAYYDYLYDCSPELVGGDYSLTRSFKPGDNQQKNVNLMHIVVVMPLLVGAGYVGYKNSKNNSQKWLFKLLGGSGALMGVYHGARFMGKI